jgi:hypothetical protein
MADGPDYIELASRLGREAFVSTCKYLFLVSTDLLMRPRAPQRTMDFMAAESTEKSTIPAEVTNSGVAPRRTHHTPQPVPLVLAIRKVGDAFRDMITIGRTGNNDLVVPDVQVSKFHAFFRMNDGRLELADAGSRNGTWVGETKLVAKGPTATVTAGTELKLGALRFRVLDAPGCWAFIRREVK